MWGVSVRAGLRSHQLLLIDDDPSLREALATTLTEDGYQVTEAADGAQARHLVGRATFHLALIDRVPVSGRQAEPIGEMQHRVHVRRIGAVVEVGVEVSEGRAEEENRGEAPVSSALFEEVQPASPLEPLGQRRTVEQQLRTGAVEHRGDVVPRQRRPEHQQRRMQQAVSTLTRLAHRDVVRRGALPLDAIVVHARAVTHDQLGRRVRQVHALRLKSRVRLDDRRARVPLDDDQRARMRRGSLARRAGDMHDLQRLGDHHAGGDVDERPVVGKRGVQRREAVGLVARDLAQVLPHRRRPAGDRRRQTADANLRGQGAQRRERRREPPVDAHQRVARRPGLDQERLQRRRTDDRRRAPDGETRLHDRRDAGKPPRFLVRCRETLAREPTDGRLAPLAQPARRPSAPVPRERPIAREEPLRRGDRRARRHPAHTAAASGRSQS